MIEPGRVTVLTGRNGAGKSTTLQAIAGLTMPSSGRVTVAGVDVADWSRPRGGGSCPGCRSARCWSRARSRDNLALFGDLDDARKGLRGSRISTRCWPSCPTGWIPSSGAAASGCRWASGNDSAWPERSDRRAPVLLLDEPTAHLDARTEDRVLRAIVERARAGATVVVVGHREPVVGDR